MAKNDRARYGRSKCPKKKKRAKSVPLGYMPWGKYTGRKMENVPTDYLCWLGTQDWFWDHQSDWLKEEVTQRTGLTRPKREYPPCPAHLTEVRTETGFVRYDLPAVNALRAERGLEPLTAISGPV